ncbi:helix-turn-helix domain-containing protein [Flavobacterium nackdongense]|uniref:AraC family transcriptional regulator n=1 Tax=Flavobacterium nackdongense TaxID=2547394 RepID=A0A4P6YAQ2_9FLAO|nr:helix-turn-helix domain-containing protein [Flavobacterium nackdongense]QBN17725.1 AraC family transcriptional regulator [Flavobacterium nackdongense]
MEYLNITFHIFSLLLALLSASLLLWVNQERKHNNRLLAFVLIIFSLQSLMQILFYSRIILITPWLLRVFAPFSFLLGPLVFVYIRSILNDELKFKRLDWILLIPAILVFINFIPFYLLPSVEKIEYLNKNYYSKIGIQDIGEGILPNILYYCLRICWSGYFIFSAFKLIYQFWKSKTNELLDQNKILLKWLFTFNSLVSTILIVAILKVFVPTINNTHITIADIILGATFLYICLKLFTSPQILYGLYLPISTSNKSNLIETIQFQTNHNNETGFVSINDFSGKTSTKIGKLNFEQSIQCNYKNSIANYFQREKPFLRADYSLNQFVYDLKIPRHILSAFINREYGMNFRLFLNHQRIDYMINNLDKPEWEKFTIEAIATECGYTSRKTFIKNFKEITGKTPSEFLKNSEKIKLANLLTTCLLTLFIAG